MTKHMGELANWLLAAGQSKHECISLSFLASGQRPAASSP
jgi:hypothetical protein